MFHYVQNYMLSHCELSDKVASYLIFCIGGCYIECKALILFSIAC
uniref:Uncharacterized protein n=1 Tax=Arundo donax TaxID=35708 RepID=A0A0A9F8S7_ARUDO